jgi:hypothetical protein
MPWKSLTFGEGGAEPAGSSGHAGTQTQTVECRVRPDARRPETTRGVGPGRALGGESAIHRDPDIGSSDKPLPGPARCRPEPPYPAAG